MLILLTTLLSSFQTVSCHSTFESLPNLFLGEREEEKVSSSKWTLPSQRTNPSHRTTIHVEPERLMISIIYAARFMSSASRLARETFPLPFIVITSSWKGILRQLSTGRLLSDKSRPKIFQLRLFCCQQMLNSPTQSLPIDTPVRMFSANSINFWKLDWISWDGFSARVPSALSRHRPVSNL